MKKHLKYIVAALAGVILVAAMAGIYSWYVPKGEAGEKQITVLVAASGHPESLFALSTEEAYLGPALREAGLVEGTSGQFGMMITEVNGIPADEKTNQWWFVSQNGEGLSVGVDAAAIQDGDQIELRLMEGY